MREEEHHLALGGLPPLTPLLDVNCWMGEWVLLMLGVQWLAKVSEGQPLRSMPSLLHGSAEVSNTTLARFL